MQAEFSNANFEAGVIAHDVSVGVEPILSLMASLKAPEVIQEVAEAER